MSGASAKAQLQQKVKRQKQFVAVGSLVLLALLGFQLPKLMGGGSETATPTITSSVPSLGSPLAATPATLPDTDRPVVQGDAGQLLSFGLFKSKDPFVQQLSTQATPLSGTPIPAPTPVPAPTATTPAPQTTTPRRTAPNGGVTPVPTTTPSSTVPFPSTTPSPTPTPIPAPTTPSSPSTTPGVTTPTTAPSSVAISTNGFCETVGLNATFPDNEDIFRVVWIAKDGKSVKIAVVGGAYDSGQASATLKMGEKLTLVNTADGTRYVISLKAKCDVQSAPVTSTSGSVTTTTPATTTVPAVPPPTTVTTPIVTDSLDTTVPSG